MPLRLVLFSRLKSILFDSLRPLKLISILLSLIAAIAIGFRLTNDPNNNLTFLSQVMPDIYWIVLFLVHMVIRYVNLFTEVTRYMKYSCNLVSSLGIWLWSMMFVGGAMLTPVETTSVMFLVVVFVEVWILSRTIIDHQKEKGRA